jgi:hypothetical protein
MASEEAVGFNFLASWLGGLVLTALTFWLTRILSWRARTNIRALVIAASFTPTVVLYLHGVVFAPAIFVLASAPLMPEHGWTYALMFGAAPIALVWSALRFWWPRCRL